MADQPESWIEGVEQMEAGAGVPQPPAKKQKTEAEKELDRMKRWLAQYEKTKKNAADANSNAYIPPWEREEKRKAIMDAWRSLPKAPMDSFFIPIIEFYMNVEDRVFVRVYPASIQIDDEGKVYFKEPNGNLRATYYRTSNPNEFIVDPTNAKAKVYVFLYDEKRDGVYVSPYYDLRENAMRELGYIDEDLNTSQKDVNGIVTARYKRAKLEQLLYKKNADFYNFLLLHFQSVYR